MNHQRAAGGRIHSPIWILVAVASLLAWGATAHGSWTGSTSCTSFAFLASGRALLGDSEDSGLADPLAMRPNEAYVFFLPGEGADFGRMHIGWMWQDTHRSFQAGMNDRGLGYSLTAVPETSMDSPNLPLYRRGEVNLFDLWMRRAATVEEAVEIAQRFVFGTLPWQAMLADAQGGALVIGPAPGGELAVTRRASDSQMLVASTFNLAAPDRYIGRDAFVRHDQAHAVLDSVKPQENPHDAARRTLEAVHRRGMYGLGGTYTVYSTVYDLTAKAALYYPLSDFDAPVRFDLNEELARGERAVPIASLVEEAASDRALRIYWATQVLGVVALAAIAALAAGAAILVGRALLG